MEAITDGIIAIAATIMVLELGVPAANNRSGLLEIRHTFLACVISFAMIYIVWSMHRDLFKKKRSFPEEHSWSRHLDIPSYAGSFHHSMGWFCARCGSP